jgi:hypothetical protein
MKQWRKFLLTYDVVNLDKQQQLVDGLQLDNDAKEDNPYK